VKRKQPRLFSTKVKRTDVDKFWLFVLPFDNIKYNSYFVRLFFIISVTGIAKAQSLLAIIGARWVTLCISKTLHYRVIKCGFRIIRNEQCV